MAKTIRIINNWIFNKKGNRHKKAKEWLEKILMK